MAYDKRIEVVSGCLLALAAGRCLGQSITNIGVAPGATQSSAAGVSADGSIVVVYSGNMYRWTASGGFQDIGAPNGSSPRGISRDGSTIIGHRATAPYSFRWSASSGIEYLPFEVTEANAINADGSIVVGEQMIPDDPAMWSPLGGIQDLGTLPGTAWGWAEDVSDDGTLVVGRCWTQDGEFVYPFAWSVEAQITRLELLPGYIQGEAIGVSGDGSVIVGDNWDETAIHPVRWTQHGVEALGLPPGRIWASPGRANQNGSVIVGWAGMPNDQYGRAFVWSPHIGGSWDLKELLASAGVEMAAWTLMYASGVSADGRVIVGGGLYNGEDRGYVVTFPLLGACCADYDGDGNLGTDADIAAFFACLSGSCCPTCCSADFNGDGDVGTDADIESFFRVLAGASC